jgi:glutaredoxin-like YruB-family protein
MNVKIYSTPECPYCKNAKAFLKANNIEYEDIDVSASDEKLKEMTDLSGQMGVPVIDVDGKILSGFNEEKLRAALGLK